MNYNLIKKWFSEYDFHENNLLFYNENGASKEKIHSNLINIIKGTYTIFINDLNILKNIQIKHLFNIVKGKIHNYFKANMDKKLNAYLIRTKILKDLNDNGKWNIIYFFMPR